MKIDITTALVDEHRLIKRMLTLLEKNGSETAAGRYLNWQFYLDGVDFIRNFADRFHHAKEEDVLFNALVDNGMPRQNSPVAAMLMEHDLGRDYVRAMEEAAAKAAGGDTAARQTVTDNALAYAELLRNHISKEDEILYPLAERIIPDSMRPGITQGYAEAENRVDQDFCHKYQALIEHYETESPE